jgi:predicted nucleotidyltransferase
MVRELQIDVPHEKVARFCQRHHIRRLALFGSVLRDDFGPDSDVDVLVEFTPGRVPGYLQLHSIEEELSGMLDHRKVDIVTIKALNRRIRDRILAEAVVQYAEG